jgi:ATP-dependent DNA helicase MPH1
MKNSDDDYFDDLDSAFLNEVDTIEASYLPPKGTTSSVPIRPAETLRHDSEDFDLSMSFDDDELQRLDTFIEDSYQGKAAPALASSSLKQTTLWGQKPPETVLNKTKKPPSGRTSVGGKNPFGKPAKKTKQWDRTAFAKSGWRKPAKTQEKEKGVANVNSDGDEEEVEFEQFPAPSVSGTCLFAFSIVYHLMQFPVGYVPFLPFIADR